MDEKEITRALAAPFSLDDVHLKPGVVKGNRALAFPYVDARAIQDRLDDVLGAGGWQDDYQVLADGSVVCRLQLRFGAEWVTKVDVGSPSEQPDGGDRLKAAFSDALKRAAVKFGIARYIHKLPTYWCDYDPQKREFTTRPTFPAWAVPAAPAGAKAPTRAPAPTQTPTTTSAPASAPSAPAGAAQRPAPPKSGKEMVERLMKFESAMVGRGQCTVGELMKHVCEKGISQGFGADMNLWTENGIAFAADECRAFEEARRQRQRQQKEQQSPA